MTLGLVAALAGMLGYGVGSVLQAAAAARASGPAVVRHPAYVAGLACDGVAWLASLVALRYLPLFVVQSVLAGSLGVTVLLARAFLAAPVRRRDGFAVAVVALCLAAVAAASGAQSAAAPPGGFQAFALTGLVVVAALTVAAYRNGASLVLASLAGLAFSGAALCARAVPTSGSSLQLVAQPLAWAVVGYGVVGALSYARSLERGPVGPATAALWGVEVLVPGAVGVVALGDGVRAGWGLPAIVAVAGAVAACAVLAAGPQTAASSPRRG